MAFIVGQMCRILMPLLDAEGGDAGGAGGGGDSTNTNTGNTNNDGGTKPVDGQTTNPQTNKPQSGTASPNTDDARTRGLLADLQKERKARQAFETEIATHKAALDTERKRVLALSGINPKSPEETDLESVRAKLTQMFPFLAKFDDKSVEKISALLEQGDSLKEATSHHWKAHGQKMLDTVVSTIATDIGGKLSDRQIARIESLYANEAANNPAFLKRHEAGDPKLIEEFAKEFIEDFIEPGRRKALSTEIDRARKVPSARDRSALTAGGKKVDFKDPKSVEDAMVESFRSHGGAFGE